MTPKLNARRQRYLEAFEAHFARQQLALKGGSTPADSLEAWFLGPKGENAEVLQSLILEALQDHVAYRRRFHPEDPLFITPEVMSSSAYQRSVAALRGHARTLMAQLQQSVPFFSMRYQGHMNWDLTMPGIVGYFAALLYNQNNVAVEASPVTTKLEMEVGNDLCRMLGYKVPDASAPPAPGVVVPWGHITCDGSVANLEALWASRNLKFYPISLKAAIQNDPRLAAAKNLQVRLLSGQLARLIDLDTWTLLNLRADDVLPLSETMADQYGIPLETTGDALATYSIQNLGFPEFRDRFLQDVRLAPVGIVPATKHYSWPKNAAILGMGSANMLDIHVGVQGRMEVEHLRQTLSECLNQQRPVITVVAVIGSTEESAVDPLRDILTLREEFRQKGLEFTVHADAAWGGYFASMLREDSPDDLLRGPMIPTLPLSAYVTEQYQALAETDSITIDPHKAGYIPYPAGGLCYRNSAMRNLVSFTAPVVFHNTADPTVGIYGVEGSKPGAAAAATYLSHKVIRPTKSGYGKILGECMFTAKKLYAQLVTMLDPRFQITMFHLLPAQKEGDDPQAVREQLYFIKQRIVGQSNQALLQDEKAMTLLQELGSDQVIVPYAFNFRDQHGNLNTSVAKANQLNQRVFELLSLRPGEDVNSKNLIVTSSQFEPSVYGKAFMDSFRQRLGVEGDEESPITFLISTVMDPWTTETPQGSFLNVIEEALRQAVHQAMDELHLA